VNPSRILGLPPRSTPGRESAPYPEQFAADVVLRDGSTVRVRPVRPDDEESLRAFLDGLSTESRWLRFFGGASVARQARRAAEVDYAQRYGLVATSGSPDAIVGHAECIRTGSDRAEVAFEIADRLQGHGLGTILLAHLATWGEQNGIRTFEAEVLPQNHRMLELFRESGFPVELHVRPDVIHVEFPTSISEDGVERFERRDRMAAEAAVSTFLRPRSVAVIGASRARGTVGGEIFHNLLAAGFNGPVYPVNPSAAVIQSVPAYPSVADIPGPVEMAVVAVPAEAVVAVARECAAKGVRALVVVSAGFSETGKDGIRRQSELLRVCRDAGMRLVGPNCLGVLNTEPGVRLNATFAPAVPAAGRVGFLSQSGALGLALIDTAAARGLGLSSFVSVGDKADISSNDLLNFWEGDDRTAVVLLYLESFGNPRRFARIARRVARSKPIVAVKSGRSPAGRRATSSHTGALVAASDVNVDALFRQSGVIRTDTLGELLDVASLLASQPIPAGNRVAVVTNSGGPGIMCADACEAEGLELAELNSATLDELHSFLPAEAGLANPVDMLATASGEDYARTLRTIAADERVDAIVVIFTPPLVTRSADVAAAIRDATPDLPRRVPLLAVFISAEGAPPELQGGAVQLPSFRYPEEAATALARAVRYGAWLERDPGSAPELPDCRNAEAAAVLAEALARSPGWLSPSEVRRLLACYGIPMPESRVVRSPTAAGQAVHDLGGAAVIKAISPTLLHKTDVGGVRAGIEGRAQAVRTTREISNAVERAGHRLDGFLVQRQLPAGVELLVGVVSDPLFGPLVACGAGGVTAELLKDVDVRLTPLTDRDAHDMLRSLRTFPLLEGYRGSPPADIAAVEDLLLRVSALVDAHPEIVEMDCNPVIAGPDGASVVDARVRVETAPPRRPWAAVRGTAPTAARGPA
jgi:acetate---CoA ligase (ADP-forming)